MAAALQNITSLFAYRKSGTFFVEWRKHVVVLIFSKKNSTPFTTPKSVATPPF